MSTTVYLCDCSMYGTVQPEGRAGGFRDKPSFAKGPQGKRQAEGLTGQGEEISMLSPLRNRFGIPGVISVIALVFAMFGGAYAATNGGDGAKATASAKQGPPGPRG